MPNKRIPRTTFIVSLIVLAVFCGGRVTIVSGQQDASKPDAAAPRRLPIRHSSGVKLTEQQDRGAGLFVQRCALCHLSKTFGTDGSKYCCVAPLGPNLSGIFKNLDSDEEQSMRQIILNGGPTFMPGWRYGLTTKDIDDIISYLKTLG